MRCRYNAVTLLQIPHQRHPMAHPLGRYIGCILWVQTLIYILNQSLRWRMQYHVILDRVITALDCICHRSEQKCCDWQIWNVFAMCFLQYGPELLCVGITFHLNANVHITKWAIPIFLYSHQSCRLSNVRWTSRQLCPSVFKSWLCILLDTLISMTIPILAIVIQSGHTCAHAKSNWCRICLLLSYKSNSWRLQFLDNEHISRSWNKSLSSHIINVKSRHCYGSLTGVNKW